MCDVGTQRRPLEGLETLQQPVGVWLALAAAAHQQLGGGVEERRWARLPWPVIVDAVVVVEVDQVGVRRSGGGGGGGGGGRRRRHRRRRFALDDGRRRGAVFAARLGVVREH